MNDRLKTDDLHQLRALLNRLKVDREVPAWVVGPVNQILQVTSMVLDDRTVEHR